ncbi:DegV family protein [Mycobacteroides salmoniphilum]|uniref:DegV domain-containing protein n=1 Tax=Mycobacteroides salmoniphilum TaxID=404941 RepID=A0A4R8STU0_9MYCO|nr:DegV family protein [Mycobacteroides salmoniphilum]TEA03824.1 DegV domain-containing protein [Mycobacteroides salmoniphilum]
MPVVVVTDSGARLQPQDAEMLGIRLVPLHVLTGDLDLRDGVDPIPASVYEKGRATTAGASPAELTEVYRQALIDSGGDGVVAVHLSGRLSSTFEAAEQAAREYGDRLHVVDSRSAAMGSGFVALAAARAAAAGADLNAAYQAARDAVGRSRCVMVVHKLDHLRRSGRISATSSWLGTALALKPVLQIDDDGKLVLAQRVRTATKAIGAMVDNIVDFVGERRVSVTIHHVDNSETAEKVNELVCSRLNTAHDPVISEMGPVLAVHVGPGAVGVCAEPVE